MWGKSCQFEGKIWLAHMCASRQGNLPCVLLSSNAFLLITTWTHEIQLQRHWKYMSHFMYSKLCLRAGVLLIYLNATAAHVSHMCSEHMSCNFCWLVWYVTRRSKSQSNTLPQHSKFAVSVDAQEMQRRRHERRCMIRGMKCQVLR